MSFKILSPYQPAGDQPKAILELVSHINRGVASQVLMGVTGSGKTFTIANTIEALNRPTLVISHNKTLAAQLYSELRAFFPYNAVEYFVSYYDYYQPEVYLPASDIYIEKELAINDELERLRLSAVAALLSDRRDVIVVASVSCIYGLGTPASFKDNSHLFRVGCRLSRNDLLKHFVEMLYSRDDSGFKRGRFRVMGDTIDLFVAYGDYGYRFIFWGDELEAIHLIDPASGKKTKELQEAFVFPANLFVMGKHVLDGAVSKIQQDLHIQVNYFNQSGQFEEAKRLQERTELDLEMLRELGYCTGIENYSRYIDGRSVGERPFCLLDYFPKDYLMVIDESHVTIPQFRAMAGGDRARKINLVAHGFRLPSAMDNRPLHFNEFEQLIHQVIFVSATPADYELERSRGLVIEQIIRPTGLLDPKIEVRPTLHQMHDILEAIHQVVKKEERVLITTLTKRMAEELTDYLVHAHIRCRYIHSEIKTLDRVTILNGLRNGAFDVLVGVNLLREGLDLPQVSLMVILDADKEGFLRNARSLIQTIGRVARHTQGRVLMYADKITPSMEQAIGETQRRRALQMDYNAQHQITPSSVYQKQATIDLKDQIVAPPVDVANDDSACPMVLADGRAPYGKKETIEARIQTLENKMYQAAEALQFLEADRLKEMVENLKKQQNS
ncbi:UvrABC system protein B [Cardinium endosymbiont cEper1 of Encarsia pergandiella]|uniref:excinuclease ABC subunit UvrB n=1 Tax=Cardinium endosymbiont of Encarsia pergandiella TaxID=249402 RepID=UPI00027EA785|nr:excinuclease ABC subunit UvrB [Cardinium endosymbiont of Encarsia pergandiella]CCM09785.1 UvrABC system protein B [Cardinium endosymbiont cEper1 of Encarsia pergandiella]